MLCLSGFELYSRWVPLMISQIRIPTYEDSAFEGFPLRKIPHPHFKGSQPQLMTLTENLITPVITRSESNNCVILLYIVLKKLRSGVEQFFQYVSLSLKKTVESRQKNRGRGKTEQNVSFSCTF